MKQVLRRVIDKGGKIQIEDIPTPNVGDNQVLIASNYSLISSGTEVGTINKTPVELAKLAIEDPWMRNAVKELIFEGTLQEKHDIVKNELFLLRAIGYSGSGIVIAKGKNIGDIKEGDRVAFAAQGHAEQVSAYANHVVKVPETVDMKNAAFVTVGGIALQGIRRANIQLGEWVVVYGLGLVGQLAVQLLLAAGAKVIGIDISESRIDLAKTCGLKYSINSGQEDPVTAVSRLTGSKGADVSMICAVSPDTSIANNAMKMTRKQGKVVFVGIVKMEIERKPFFENELDLLFSRAYGPGSYDDAYEKGRIDYPYQYVRWTEKRNLEEVIRLIDDGKLKLEPLIDSVFPVEETQQAFDRIREGKMKSVAMLLEYKGDTTVKTTISFTPVIKTNPTKKKINISVIGTGNFTRNYHIPNLTRIDKFHLRGLCSASGVNATSAAKLHHADFVTSNYHEILQDKDTDLVMIATRHDMHARIAIEAAKAGKDIFLEKPIAMTLEELEEVKKVIAATGVNFIAGYNRRHSQHAIRAKKYLKPGQPVIIKYTVNIQHLPDSHWTLDSVEGGGRLVGESDHFFDLMNYLTDSDPLEISAHSFPQNENEKQGMFNFMVQIKYRNNSLAQLTYTSLGGPYPPRENVEIFTGKEYLNIYNFSKLYVNGKSVLSKSDMGHFNELHFVADALTGDKTKLFNPFYASEIALNAQSILTNKD